MVRFSPVIPERFFGGIALCFLLDSGSDVNCAGIGGEGTLLETGPVSSRHNASGAGGGKLPSPYTWGGSPLCLRARGRSGGK